MQVEQKSQTKFMPLPEFEPRTNSPALPPSTVKYPYNKQSTEFNPTLTASGLYAEGL